MTFSSLPLEIVVEILRLLPVPAWEPGRPPERSALVATARVSRELRSLSQQLLFRRVWITNQTQGKMWAKTGAGQFTVELWFVVKRLSKARHWVEEVLGTRLGLNGPQRCQPLKVLLIRLPNGGTLSDKLYSTPQMTGKRAAVKLGSLRCADGWREIVGCSARVVLNQRSPPQHIVAHRIILLAPSRVDWSSLRPVPRIAPRLAQLTHLTLVCLPANLPALDALFPNLTHLSIHYFIAVTNAATLLARTVPATLTHFDTHADVSEVLCAALPNGLTHLTVSLGRQNDFDAIRQRWCCTSEGGARLGMLQVLSLRATWHSAGVAALGRARAGVEAIERAGCEVRFP